jgi:hypothetical protein
MTLRLIHGDSGLIRGRGRGEDQQSGTRKHQRSEAAAGGEDGGKMGTHDALLSGAIRAAPPLARPPRRTERG